MTRSSIDRPSHSIHVELGARSYAIVIRRDLLREIGEELSKPKSLTPDRDRVVVAEPSNTSGVIDI